MPGRRYFVCFSYNSKTPRLCPHIAKNKILIPFALLCVCSLSIPFFTEKVKILSHSLFLCNVSDPSDRQDIFVPGQIRTVRTGPRMHLHEQSKPKTILLWTKYFSEEYSSDFYFFQKGDRTFKQYNCEFSDCAVTTDRSLLPTVDAVLFHGRDISFTDVPKRPNGDQIWILYSMEAPRHMVLKRRTIRSLFNWTMTYRSDSDVQVKYGEVLEANSSCSLKPVGHRKSFQRTKGAIWMVSNCRTESRREAYVRELRKFYSVDIYGKCGRRKRCEPPQSDFCYRLLSDYKYYLSFENSICKDYITEKFFNVLQYDVVPVVYGGGDYATIAPNNSFIDATQFSSPKRLAEHLERIANDATSYERFFEWKSRYSVHLHPWMCSLCKRLHEPRSELPTKTKAFWNWWIPSAKCRRWDKKKGFKHLF